MNGPGNPNGTGVVALGEFSFLDREPAPRPAERTLPLATLELEGGPGAGVTLLELINLCGSSLGGVGGLALGDSCGAQRAAS